MDKDKVIKIYLEGYKEGQEEAWSNIKNLVSKYDGWELKTRVESRIGTLYEDVDHKRAELYENLDDDLSFELEEEEKEGEGEKGEERKEREEVEGTEIRAEDKGNSYLIIEKKLDRGFEEFNELLEGDISGLFITRKSPEKTVKQYAPPEKKAGFVWLAKGGGDISDIEGLEGDKTSPGDLSTLSSKIGKFLKSTQNGVIFLSGIPYLVNYNGQSKVLKLVSFAKDKVTANDGYLLVSLSGSAVEENFLERLKEEFDAVITK